MAPHTPHPRAARLSPPTPALPSAMVRSSAAACRSVYTAGSSDACAAARQRARAWRRGPLRARLKVLRLHAADLQHAPGALVARVRNQVVPRARLIQQTVAVFQRRGRRLRERHGCRRDNSAGGSAGVVPRALRHAAGKGTRLRCAPPSHAPPRSSAGGVSLRRRPRAALPRHSSRRGALLQAPRSRGGSACGVERRPGSAFTALPRALRSQWRCARCWSWRARRAPLRCQPTASVRRLLPRCRRRRRR